MKNPFAYNPYNRFSFINHLAETDDPFSDRKKIRADILSRFRDGRSNVVLYGPRGYGTSSLAIELEADLRKADVRCVTLDVAKLPSIDLFVSSYVTKVFHRLKPDQFEFSQIETFLKSLKPKKIANWMGEERLFYNSTDAPISFEALTEVLDLPQKLLPEEDRAVVIFDEFQEVKDLLPNDMFERTMRSVIQSHSNVSYLFLGSHYHVLQMFTDPNRPLYKSAAASLLDKPPVDESIRFVVDRFARARMTIDRKDAEHLVAKARNTPCFLQQLASETFRLVNDEHRKNVSNVDVNVAFSNVSRSNRNLYEQLMLTLSGSQKKLLIALAHERTSDFGGAYRWWHLLGASSSVSSAKAKLMENGLVEFSDGHYMIFDPFFERFLFMA